MNDSDIVRLFLERDETALAAVERKFGERCRFVAANILGSRTDAEDCVNDAYLKLWELIPPNRPKVLGSYLCRLVRNTAVDMLRTRLADKRGRGTAAVVFEELAEIIPDKNDVENTYESKALLASIEDFLNQEPARERRIFILRYWYGCAVSEIAKRYGARKNTVSVILSRTRKRLREHLEKEGYEI